MKKNNKFKTYSIAHITMFLNYLKIRKQNDLVSSKELIWVLDNSEFKSVVK